MKRGVGLAPRKILRCFQFPLKARLCHFIEMYRPNENVCGAAPTLRSSWATAASIDRVVESIAVAVGLAVNIGIARQGSDDC